MSQTHRSSSVTIALMLVGLLGWPAVATAQLGGLLPPPPTSTTQAFVGNAKAVQATVLGATTVLADTGTLADANDAREASGAAGSIPSLLGGEALHAATISWPDQVASEASVGSLGITVAGTTIAADFVMARALDVSNAAGSGTSSIDNLSINGAPIYVTGEPNQTVWIPGGQLIINEQSTSSAGTTVNALHLVVTGVADVVIASATAGIS